MYHYKLEVKRVVDGDTVDGVIDLGFNIFTAVRIRLAGINAPESRTRNLVEKKYGIEAKLRLVELLCPDMSQVTVQSHGLGKYGRVLGTLFVDDKNINQQLVSEGYAVEYNGGKRMEVDELLEHLDKVKENVCNKFES
jgi:micrococcal nuclease